MTAHTKSNGGVFFLLRAPDAITNWRAIVMSVSALLILILIAKATFSALVTNGVLGFIVALLMFVVSIIAYSAVGILLMRKSQGQEVLFFDAILQAVFTVHRMLGVALILFLIFLAVCIAALLLLFVCRLPEIGPFLFGLVFPIVTVIVGTTLVATVYVAFPLAAPSIWSGNTIYETIARLTVIVKQRLFIVITNLAVLSILVLFISGVVSFLLFSGYSTSIGLASITGIKPMGGLLQTMQVLMLGGGSGFGEDLGGLDASLSYIKAFGFASTILFVIGFIIPFLTFINGTCLTYLHIVEGLDFNAAEQKLQEQIDEAKRRTQDAKDRASAKLQEAKVSMQKATTTTQARHCTNCHASLAPDDVFCGECGTKNPL